MLADMTQQVKEKKLFYIQFYLCARFAMGTLATRVCLIACDEENNKII